MAYIYRDMDVTNLSLTVGVTRKVNLGNYNSAERSVYISGITADTTEEEIDDLLSGAGALAFKKTSAKLHEEIQKAIKEATT